MVTSASIISTNTATSSAKPAKVLQDPNQNDASEFKSCRPNACDQMIVGGLI